MVAVAAITSAVVGVVSLGVSLDAASQAQYAQEKSRNAQMGQQASQAATERRQQVREERVRRARIMQASQNTGTAGSSGEIAAIGGMATQLGSNIGANLAAKAAGQEISIFNQQASDAMFTSQQAGQLFALSSQIFGATAGKAASSIFGATPAAIPNTPAVSP
jgi:hypothetical protein